FAKRSRDAYSRHEQAHRDRKAGPAKSVGKIVESWSDRQVLRHTRMNHGPDSEAGGHAVEYRHESSKQCDIRASSVDTQKAQPAHYGRGEDTEGDQCADLQKNADQHIHWVRVKVRNDDIGRFPGTGPIWLPHSEWRAEGADRGKTGVEEYGVCD